VTVRDGGVRGDGRELSDGGASALWRESTSRKTSDGKGSTAPAKRQFSWARAAGDTRMASERQANNGRQIAAPGMRMGEGGITAGAGWLLVKTSRGESSLRRALGDGISPGRRDVCDETAPFWQAWRE